MTFEQWLKDNKAGINNALAAFSERKIAYISTRLEDFFRNCWNKAWEVRCDCLWFGKCHDDPQKADYCPLRDKESDNKSLNPTLLPSAVNKQEQL